MDNSNEAVNKILGLEVPVGLLKINIIENKPGVDHTIIIPPESRALKDEELDQIAGGGAGVMPLS